MPPTRDSHKKMCETVHAKHDAEIEEIVTKFWAGIADAVNMDNNPTYKELYQEACMSEIKGGEGEEQYYLPKDKQTFETGAQRDTASDKPRLDLLPWEVFARDCKLYEDGAIKYDDHNWKKGIPSTRCLQSLLRHVLAVVEGDEEEDHLAMIRFNAACIMYNQDVHVRNSIINNIPDHIGYVTRSACAVKDQ